MAAGIVKVLYVFADFLRVPSVFEDGGKWINIPKYNFIFVCFFFQLYQFFFMPFEFPLFGVYTFRIIIPPFSLESFKIMYLSRGSCVFSGSLILKAFEILFCAVYLVLLMYLCAR